MSLIIPLDTGPLGILTNPKRSQTTQDAIQWASLHIRAGNRFLVPAIADYEVRRELTRLGRAGGILTLDAWNNSLPDRYLPLTDSALRLAATLWARSRNAGRPTGDPKELDCDVLIAAQALDYQISHALPAGTLIMATVNVGHLSQFLPADYWQNILP